MNSQQTMPIILASSSPRRLYLMSQVHLKVEVQNPDIDERAKPREKPEALVARLAREKAHSVKNIAVQKYPECLIISADTIVVAPNGTKVLGKPDSVDDAKKTLKLLSGKKHTVLTGYCILHASQKRTKNVVRVVRSKVKMRALSKEMIDLYVASGEPMDKAGAYGAQGLGMALIERIEGSYSNVVGLPMAQIFLDFEKVFKLNLFCSKAE